MSKREEEASDVGPVDSDLVARGDVAMEAGDTEQAFALYREAAGQGSADGAYRLGFHAEQAGHADAINWYNDAVAAGHVPAMINLGAMCARDGMIAHAVSLWKMAALEGSVDAMLNLGSLLDVFPEHGSAREWFEMAAEHGDQQALVRMVEFDAEEVSE
jgi:TPR repeat protein